MAAAARSACPTRIPSDAQIQRLLRRSSHSEARHTAATKLLKRTGNAKLVQRYLGHSDVATTLRFYVDVFPEDLKRAAELLSEKEKVILG